MPPAQETSTTISSQSEARLLQQQAKRLALILESTDFGSTLEDSPSRPSTPSKFSEVIVAEPAATTSPASEPTVSALQLIYAVCNASSDIVFAFPSLLTPFQNGAPSAGDAQLVELQMRPDAAHVIYGSASARTPNGAAPRISVLAPSQALDVLSPAIFELAEQQTASTFHLSSFRVNLNESALQNNRPFFSDHSQVMRARNSGALVLASSNLFEAYDVALLSSFLATQLNHPVIHFFDGLSVAAQATSLVGPTNSAKLRRRSFRTQDEDQLEPEFRFSLRDGNAAVQIVEELFEECSAAMLSGRTYRAVEYYGSTSATSAIVIVAATGASALISTVKRMARSEGYPIGLAVVRLIRPWPAEQLLRAIPTSVQRLLVLDFDFEQTSSTLSSRSAPLFQDVSLTVRSLGRRSNSLGRTPVALVAGNLAGVDFTFSSEIAEHVCNFILDASTTELSIYDPTLQVQAEQPKKRPTGFRRQTYLKKEDVNEIVVYSDAIDGAAAASVLGSPASGEYLATLSFDDSYSCRLPVSIQHVRRGSKPAITSAVQTALPIAVGSASTVVVVGAATSDILRFIDVARELKPGGALVVVGTTAADLRKQLTADLITKLVAKEARLYCLQSTTTLLSTLAELEALTPLALAAPKLENEDDALLEAHRPCYSPVGTVPTVSRDTSPLQQSLHSQVCASLIWPKSVPSVKQCATAEHAGAFLLRVATSTRLTPTSYDRNVFHMEFERVDGEPLSYAIGDALGIAPQNDSEQVQDFLRWYFGASQDLNELVTVPEIGIRTLTQAFIQCLDIFGKPSTSFYRRLAELATDPSERQTLSDLVSPSGSELLKGWTSETVTFADVLRSFPSARPSLAELLELVTAIKMRVYSIASSNKMHPTQVHLLVVVHDWVTPSGKRQIGTSTRYLDSLRVGDTVIAALKPSAMVLPPDHRQPVIMAGLGTGMAPFRAFIEERAFIRSQGVEVGPMFLYFGSRHRRMEYLYGDELEAYAAAGVLTRLQLAFSRDQDAKVYIQHKLQQDARLIGDLLSFEQAHFYLCGPTWPVPDVEAALATALRTAKPAEVLSDAAIKTIFQEMKDQHRYVLEVY